MVYLAAFAALAGLGLKWLTYSLRKDPRVTHLPPAVAFGSTALLAVAGLLLVFSSIVIIHPGNVGVQVIFGSVKDNALSAGMHVINPFVEVTEMSVRTEMYTMSATASEGQRGGDDSVSALSSDGLFMPLDVTIAFRLVGTDAAKVYSDFGANYVENILRPAARTAVREAIAGFTAQEAYSTKREELPLKMQELLTSRMKALLSEREDFRGKTGFIVDQVMLRKIQLPDKVKNAIEAKLEAAQQAEQMQFVLDKERQEAERKRIEAKGVSDFQTIVSQSINTNLLEWKGIEATETLAKSQNAKIVIIGSGKNGLPVILNPDR